MKIIKSLLVLLISMSFVSCSNDVLSSSSSTHNSFNNQEIGEVYISFNNKRVEKNASINIETELIYGIDVRSKGFCPNIRLEYNKEYFETRDYFNFSEPNTGSYNRFFVKDKEGETSLKVYVNDVFQSEYHFIVSDNSIDYTLIDKTKNKYISPENIVKLTSLDEYKSYIESINYREKCTFTENYFKETDKLNEELRIDALEGKFGNIVKAVVEADTENELLFSCGEQLFQCNECKTIKR